MSAASNVAPLPSAERRTLTEKLRATSGSDVDRWRDVASVKGHWDWRAAAAARFIPASSRVLDLGAGAMALRRFLAPNCVYVPCDLVARVPDALVADLNKGEFPSGTYDWVTTLGVLEYLHDVPAVLARMADAARHAVVTYCLDTAKAIEVRRGMGWVNDYDRVSFCEMLDASPWRVADAALLKRGAYNEQILFVLAQS